MKRLHKKLDFPFRRALAVLLAAAMTFALTGCSVRELHIGQVEVNTGAGTAGITRPEAWTGSTFRRPIFPPGRTAA